MYNIINGVADSVAGIYYMWEYKLESISKLVLYLKKSMRVLRAYSTQKLYCFLWRQFKMNVYSLRHELLSEGIPDVLKPLQQDGVLFLFVSPVPGSLHGQDSILHYKQNVFPALAKPQNGQDSCPE